MIVDAHMHLSGSGYVRGKYLRFVWTMYITEYNRVHHTNKTATDFRDMLLSMDPPVVDPEGDHVVEMMDKAGVDKGVIFPVDWEPVTGAPKVPLRDQNKAHADAAKKHEGRFIPICALDPRRGNALDLAKEAIEAEIDATRDKIARLESGVPLESDKPLEYSRHVKRQ